MSHAAISYNSQRATRCSSSPSGTGCWQTSNPLSERKKHNIRLLHLETDGQTAVICRLLFVPTSGSFCGAFYSENQRNPDPGEENILFLILSQWSRESAFEVSGEKKGQTVYVQPPHKGIKREPSTQPPCRNLYIHARFAARTCSCSAAPCFVLHTFTEQLKSFICPD